MCGILCLLRKTVIDEDVLRVCGLTCSTCREDVETLYEARIEDFSETLRRRGPDLFAQIQVMVQMI